MSFELAYDLALEEGKEVVFVVSSDWHRKVRVLLTEVDREGNQMRVRGNSLGSSFKGIKAAKKDEPPVVVEGTFALKGETWRGTLEPAAS